MQRASSSSAKNIFKNLTRNRNRILKSSMNQVQKPCDVFINHRGIDTKKNVAGLLYDHIKRLGLQPFLDSKSMKPGDKLFDKINAGIRQCKVGVAVFSPNYCKSYFCLHELALMMETKKKVVPIFCNVKPSELKVLDYGTSPPKDLERFSRALEEAKNTVGLTFDTSSGDWSEFLEDASEAVIENLIQLEEEEEEEEADDPER
ncbi:OLC1v1021608C1 [Oldenlandia corymbosa var. corymbosa]|uniref:OLC1v1021608C1 n=1 Tax=Oldenlandia corymbosa var. corymbosa TaxID=529605 RepID=A0AAV1BYA7_OLDCO|nr:OLC1v1021608C1 [Oldenlandia corymbosa var. corymbosa]